MPRSAFVTGGTGFIGSHLVEELTRQGYDEIRCLIRSEAKWLEGLDVVEVRADLFDDDAIADAVRGVDYIYHVGGVTRATDWDTFERSNVRATMNLLRIVERENSGVQRLLITSSLAAVGSCRSGIATEESPLKPVSRYGRSKALMEQEISRASTSVPVTVVRPPAVYGPREADIFTFFQAVNRGICPIVGNPHEAALSLVHVSDVVRGMVGAAESPATAGQTYFVGSETFYSWSDVKQATTKALGRRALTVAVPPSLVTAVGAAAELFGRVAGRYPPLNREKAREIRHTCKKCSVDKAKRHYGYEQRVPLEEGIDDTIKWYIRNGWL